MASLLVKNTIVFPLRLVAAANLQGNGMRNNTRLISPGGQIAVNIKQAKTRRQWQFGTTPMAPAIWQTVEAVWEVTDAGASGFLLEVAKDGSALITDGLMAPYGTTLVGSIGVGYGMPSQRLYKRYTAIGGADTYDRRISRPRGTPSLYRGGSPVTIGVAAGNAAVNADTGTVTFVADASQSMTTVTAGASTTFNFANGTGIVATMSVGQRVYISGVVGTMASTVNGKSHAITSKGATSLTVSTVTTGLVATNATGTAAKYPQATEALTWAGNYYVPVHFTDDKLDWGMVRPAASEGGRLFVGPSVMLEEVLE